MGLPFDERQHVEFYALGPQASELKRSYTMNRWHVFLGRKMVIRQRFALVAGCRLSGGANGPATGRT